MAPHSHVRHQSIAQNSKESSNYSERSPLLSPALTPKTAPLNVSVFHGFVQIGNDLVHQVPVGRFLSEGRLQQGRIAEERKHLFDPAERFVRQVPIDAGLEQPVHLLERFEQVVEIEAVVHLVERNDGHLQGLELGSEPVGQFELVGVELAVPVEDGNFDHDFDDVFD